MKLAASGLTMGTTVSSMVALLQVSYAIHGRPPEGDFKPPQAADSARNQTLTNSFAHRTRGVLANFGICEAGVRARFRVRRTGRLYSKIKNLIFPARKLAI